MSYGFRPFFLLAGLQAAGTIGLTIAGTVGMAWPDGGLSLYRWHAHEMIFGFVGAAIGGFLLTAVPNWTGSRPIGGSILAALVAIWIAGRLALFPFLPVPAVLAAGLDLAYFPALAIMLTMPLLRAGKAANAAFLILLCLFFATNLTFHAMERGLIAGLGFDPLRIAIDLVILLISIVGGRIIPAFTRNALVGRGIPVSITNIPALDVAAIAAIALLIVVDLVGMSGTISGSIAGGAAVLHAIRLARWRGWQTRSDPLLWVLHVGYAWLVAGLVLKAVWQIWALEVAVNWLHAFTAGAIPTMILAVSSRASLGHTGRPLVASPMMVAAYFLITIGAVLRVFWPTLWPTEPIIATVGAGLVWGGAFLAYTVTFIPILFGPRVDE